MMGLSKLSAKCMTCPYVDNCDHKRMEAVGFLPEPTLLVSASQPVLRETMEVRIKGKPMIVYKDEIEKQLYGHMYKGLGLFAPAT